MSEARSLQWPKDYFRIEPVDPALSPPDIAFAIADVAADEGNGALQPLPINLLFPGQRFEIGASMVAVGFPGSKAKTRGGPTKLSAKLMSVVGDLASDDVYPKVGKSADTHFAMSFRQDACVDENSLPASAAHPRGMSGGPMFVAAYHTEESGRSRFVPRVVGVLTEYHADPENVLLAVRIEVLLDALGIRPEGSDQRYRAVDA